MMDQQHPLDSDPTDSDPLDSDPLAQTNQFRTDAALQGEGVAGEPSVGGSPANEETGSDSFRFGIKSLAAVVILPAVVLATISYFGILLGLLASFGLSCLILGAMLFAAISFHRRLHGRIMRQVDVWVVLLSLLTLGLFFGVTFAGGSQAAVYFLSDLKLAQKYNEELGFTHESEMNLFNGRYIQTIRIKSVSPGGEFETAGFLPGDVIVNYDSKEFFRTLEKSQGQPVTVSVATAVSGITTIDLNKHKQRELTINVPSDN